MNKTTPLLLMVLLLTTNYLLNAQQKDFPIKVSKVVVDIADGTPIEVIKNPKKENATNVVFYLKSFRSSNYFYPENIKSSIEKQLVKQGLEVEGWTGLFPELEEQEEPLIALGVIVKRFVIKRNSGLIYNNYRIETDLQWQALDLRTNQIVYKNEIKTNAAFETKDLVIEASGSYQFYDHSKQIDSTFYLAVNQLLADANFQSILQKQQVNPLGVSDSMPTIIAPVKLAQSANFLSNAIKGTVTLKSPMGFGSGFFINDEGLILTCYHNFKEARPVKVYLSQGVVMEAEVVKTNPDYDIALLQLKGLETTALPINSKGSNGVGSETYVIGTPANEALNQSVSKGIISGNRSIESKTFLQTDASVSPGNSGGPMINNKGEVLGIVNAKVVGYGAEGIGFAIPINVALEQLNIQLTE